MKLSLAAKTTLLVQVIYLTTAVLVVLLLHNHFRSFIISSHQGVYELRLHDVLNELAGRNAHFKTLAGQETDLKAYQNAVIEDLRQRYLSGSNLETFPAIVDAAGTVLLHPHLPGGDRSLQSFFPRDLVPGHYGLIDTAAAGNGHLVFYSHFPEWDWLVCWFVPKKTVTDAFNGFRTALLVLLLASFAGMGLVLMYFMTMMLKPLSALTGRPMLLPTVTWGSNGNLTETMKSAPWPGPL